MNAQPALFVPHGSPMFALNPGAAGAALRALAGQLTRPRVVVVVSPHWETLTPTLGAATTLPTIYDFSGFDRRLYELSYPATGCPVAALEVAEALRAARLPIALDATRGLDHGAWVPLRHMFPDADVPVVPLSIQYQEGPTFAYAVGRALSPLLERGFLIVGSGNITHIHATSTCYPCLPRWAQQARVRERPPSTAGSANLFWPWMATFLDLEDTHEHPLPPGRQDAALADEHPDHRTARARPLYARAATLTTKTGVVLLA